MEKSEDEFIWELYDDMEKCMRQPMAKSWEERDTQRMPIAIQYFDEYTADKYRKYRKFNYLLKYMDKNNLNFMCDTYIIYEKIRYQILLLFKLFILDYFYREYLIKLKYIKNKKSYIYLTLSPDKYLRNLDNTEHNRNALYNWTKNWLEYNPKYYGDYMFAVECGSQGDHLHVHIVAEIKNSHRHAEFLKKSWAKHFPHNQLLTTLNIQTTYKCENCKNGCCKNPKHRGEYAYLGFDDEQILRDKIEYFCNEKKGSHENLYDLNLDGVRGFRGVLY